MTVTLDPYVLAGRLADTPPADLTAALAAHVDPTEARWAVEDAVTVAAEADAGTTAAEVVACLQTAAAALVEAAHAAQGMPGVAAAVAAAEGAVAAAVAEVDR